MQNGIRRNRSMRKSIDTSPGREATPINSISQMAKPVQVDSFTKTPATQASTAFK